MLGRRGELGTEEGLMVNKVSRRVFGAGVMAAALGASYLPARAAARVDPIQTLREA